MVNKRTNKKQCLSEDALKFCYIDESGMGQEPVATMARIIVDSGRMHVTKQDWSDLLAILDSITKRTIVELKASDFYAGNGVWRDLDGDQRARVIQAVFEWITKRRHHVVYSSVNKINYFKLKGEGYIPSEIETYWQLMGFHITLSIQKYSQPEKVPKGNTILTFDNHEQDEKHFIQLVKNPPSWSDGYYNRGKKQNTLDQIIDIPHFADSKDIGLLQVADFVSFFLRRYAEIKDGLDVPAYFDEEDKLNYWVSILDSHMIPSSNIYLKRGRKEIHNIFCKCASPAIMNYQSA